MIFIFRRILVSLILVFFQFNQVFQMVICLICSFLSTIYLLKTMPYEQKYDNYLAVYNEIMTMINAYILIALALISQQGILDGDQYIRLGDPQFEYNLSNFLIFLVLFQIMVNIICITFSLIKIIYRKICLFIKKSIFEEKLVETF